jgi:hypothetical protein
MYWKSQKIEKIEQKSIFVWTAELIYLRQQIAHVLTIISNKFHPVTTFLQYATIRKHFATKIILKSTTKNDQKSIYFWTAELIYLRQEIAQVLTIISYKFHPGTTFLQYATIGKQFGIKCIESHRRLRRLSKSQYFSGLQGLAIYVNR